MKLALIFLSICVVLSHQQYDGYSRMMYGIFPWLTVPSTYYQNLAFYNNHRLESEQSDEIDQMGFNSRNPMINDEEGEFSDTHSRVKGINRYHPRPSSFNDLQNARFLFNLFASTSNTFNNPLLKTATFTSTQTLSLTSVVNCVPIDQVVANPPTCVRRRRRHSFNDETEEEQYSIVPSETLDFVPTALSSLPQENRSLDELISSTKDDSVSSDGMLTNRQSLRDKRFFINKNQFVVSSTLTTYTFVNTTVTATVNLLNPLPAPPAGGAAPVACVPATGTAPITCARCLPPGYIICPVATG